MHHLGFNYMKLISDQDFSQSRKYFLKRLYLSHVFTPKLLWLKYEIPTRPESKVRAVDRVRIHFVQGVIDPPSWSTPLISKFWAIWVGVDHDFDPKPQIWLRIHDRPPYFEADLAGRGGSISWDYPDVSRISSSPPIRQTGYPTSGCSA